MGEALLPIINPTVREKYGLEISSFILENVSVPAEVEQAIDKQSSMRAIGNLNDYVKYQMGLSMGQELVVGVPVRKIHCGCSVDRIVLVSCQRLFHVILLHWF